MTRMTTLARYGVGAVAAGVPGRVLRATTAPCTPLGRETTRLLGLRYLAQATTARTAGTPARLDATVDLLHAASMVPVAVLSRRYRRAALTSGSAALALGTIDLLHGAGR